MIGEMFDTLLTEKRLDGQLETVRHSDMMRAVEFLTNSEHSAQSRLF